MDISLFGLGYVGAVTAGCLTQAGHKIIGADVQAKKVAAFNTGRSPIVEPELDELLQSAKADGRLSGTTDAAEAVAQSTVSIVCVGTPSQENGRLNLNYVRQVSGQIAEAIRAKGKPHTLIYRSTMLPGSTGSMVEEFFKELIAEKLVTVLYCPEFLREGTAVRDFREPSLSVIGTLDGGPTGDAALEGLLGGTPEILNWEGAELIKYTCNYFHAVKVAFANEIGRVGKSAGVDSRRVMDVICKDTRLNISKYYLRPGNPFGGSCLPKDVSALAAFARQEGVVLPMLNSVMPTNQAHLDALIAQIDNTGAKRISIIGLAFKHDTDDLRGSPMVAVAENILAQGKQLKIYDPNLNMAEVIGANEQVISRTMPHLAQLLTQTAADAIAESELIIVAQKCVPLEELEAAVKSSHQILDVNSWDALKSLPCSYTGSCW
jgi:GDP-mannose 6-dehydrogenase